MHQEPNYYAPSAHRLDAVGILPWLELPRVVPIGDVILYPREEALVRLGEQAAGLDSTLSRFKPAIADDRELRPSVAIALEQLSDGAPFPGDKVRRAIDIFIAAAAFSDSEHGYFFNATTCELYEQRFDGSDLNSFTARRRNGVMFHRGRELTITRPLYAARYLWHSHFLLEALVEAATIADEASANNDLPPELVIDADAQDAEDPSLQVWSLFEALAWFRRASTDSPTIDREVDRALLRTAIDFLTDTPATPAVGGFQQSRVAQLLAPFTTIDCCFIKTKAGWERRSFIQAALWVLNEDRNGTLHPKALERRGRFGFEFNPRLTLDWIADRCFFALLIARLVELKIVPLAEESRAYVEAVERWLADASAENYREVLQRGQVRAEVETRSLELVVEMMKDVDADRVDPDWEKSFYDALGGRVHDHRWEVNLLWRREPLGPMAQILERAPRQTSLHELVPFDAGTNPNDAALMVAEVLSRA